MNAVNAVHHNEATVAARTAVLDRLALQPCAQGCDEVALNVYGLCYEHLATHDRQRADAVRAARDARVVATLESALLTDALDLEGVFSILEEVAVDFDSDVVADFAIDLQADLAHAGAGQPEWAYRAVSSW